MKTRLETTISLLRRGWITPLESASQGGVLALSQRVGELERSGVNISRKWVDTGRGVRVMAYRIAKTKAA